MKKKQISQDLIYGIHPLLELLRAKKRRIVTLYTTKPTPKVWPTIERILPKGTQIQYVSRDILTRMAGTTDHQSIVAWVMPFQIRKKFFDPNREKFLLMLDGIQDPRNLGAILRSAYCSGVDGVILTKQKGAPLSATALKSSAGLAEHLEIYIAPSARAAVQELKNAGYVIYLAALGGKDARNIAYDLPMCIVIGNEGSGISPEILKQGTKVMLAQKESEISYNASVAAGILLFFISSQQKII